ncbi:protein phosphatase 2C domain-containing protein [Planomicrobium sp. CPCC 101079]|uniref:protein phosphatase 2C domain-containing protein n=1 Tax=Planomicrobium sp. CPCC 101079 TaxID=2599618 RepID=UPI0011B78CA3|nr:protein phosphatase 2C domain-containing protein [Planomicrobium sp. CPCC 101079]TWT13207.1 protein phosphatase 2C domain-containing protein [Planomicrobium sp. CPCC 101079]
MTNFSWVGSEQDFVDQPDVKQVGNITVGRFGGNSLAGQYKNEDACAVWTNEKEDWEFVLVLDAHNTAESAELVVKEFMKNKEEIQLKLAKPLTAVYFQHLEDQVLMVFQNEEFRKACRELQGETACIIVVRKGKFVWWLSIGDCVLYLFHHELAAMGQFQLNQRHFYEWVGQVNTFDRLVPCFSSGTKELREGDNHLFVTTDGLLECPGEPYSNPRNLAAALTDVPLCDGIHSLLKTIQENGVRDSSTVVSWHVDVREAATYASNQ